jgi:hypothetical protein
MFLFPAVGFEAGVVTTVGAVTSLLTTSGREPTVEAALEETPGVASLGAGDRGFLSAVNGR